MGRSRRLPEAPAESRAPLAEAEARDGGRGSPARGARPRGGVDPRRIDPLRAMTSYGLDSLAAVELRNAVEAELGVALPIAELLEGMSLRERRGERWRPQRQGGPRRAPPPRPPRQRASTR